MKDKLKAIIEKLEKAESVTRKITIDSDIIDELKSLIQEEKWEPKEYKPNWTVDSGGGVYKSDEISEKCRLYGSEFPTKELAKTARDMSKRNQLILQAKHEMGYGDGRFFITWDNEDKKWTTEYRQYYYQNPELNFETREQAEQILKMVGLNDE